MNTNRKLVAASAIFTWICAAAHATPELTLFPHQPSQPGNDSNSMSIGLSVQGHTSWHTLTVGGGYTVTCDSSALSILAERAFGDSDIFGNITLLVTVPTTTPANYPIPGYSALQPGNCKQCAFYYRGRAVDASASISGSGLGANFTFNVGGDHTLADTKFFNVCRATSPGGGGGCED